MDLWNSLTARGRLRPGGARRNLTDEQLVAGVGTDLLREVERCSMEELRSQDQTYDRDSRLGRELLFLIANSDWIRGTVENVTLERSRSVDTNLEVDIDLHGIDHEGFWEKEHVWLPVLAIPAGRDRERQQSNRVQDFPAITITDASGALLSTLPQAVVRRQLAAAMAEIIVNMAASRWPIAFPGAPSSSPGSGADAAPAPEPGRLVATREQRLVLSAAILRMFSGGPGWSSDIEPLSVDALEQRRPATDRGHRRTLTDVDHRSIGPRRRAKDEVLDFLIDYLGLYARVDVGTNPVADLVNRRAVHALTERTALVLHALTDAVHVVVEMDQHESGSVLTIHVPARRLATTGRWWWLMHRHATVTVDLLAPSSQTPRDIRVDLPPGLACETGNRRRFGADILVQEPEPLLQLQSLMGQLLDPGTDRRPSVQLCLADLAAEKVPAVQELFRSHRLVGGEGASDAGRTRDVMPALDHLQAVLEGFRARVNGTPSVSREELGRAWSGWERVDPERPEKERKLHWLKGELRRVTTDETLSSRAVHLHVEGVGQPGLRPAPVKASTSVKVVVSDAPVFSAARYASSMSLVLILAVGMFFVWQTTFNVEVLAGALTIFSAISATRVEYPDRTTLLGRLSTIGYILVALSILPTIGLAVALAFAKEPKDAAGFGRLRSEIDALVSGNLPFNPLTFAIVAFLVQGVVALLMWLGPLSGKFSRIPTRGLELATWPTPDHRRSRPLQSAWWKSTTADALRLGRTAHAYVVWQPTGGRSASPSTWWYAPLDRPVARSPRGPRGAALELLQGLLGDQRVPDGGAQPAPDRPAEATNVANILSLVEAGTGRRSVTFYVFREEPGQEWRARHEASIPVPLRPDLLAPSETPTDFVNVFVGVGRADDVMTVRGHALSWMMRRAQEFGLGIGDVQLPVPPPAHAPPGLVWGRIQVALHSGDTRALGPFLQAISDPPKKQFGRRAVVVQLGLELRSRVIVPDPAAIAPRAELTWLPATELDVAAGDPRPGNVLWMALAVTANARPGIENDVLNWLGRERADLRLKGLVTATLHGTAVMFVLARRAHQAELVDRLDRYDLTDRLQRAFAADHLNVSIRLHPANELAFADRKGDETLLHVHLRSKDRPGLVASLMASLDKVLTDMTDRTGVAATGETQLDPWYALLQVVERGTARARVTLRVPARLAAIGDWEDESWETAEQAIRRLLSGENGRDLSWRENLDSTVINLEMVPRWSVK